MSCQATGLALSVPSSTRCICQASGQEGYPPHGLCHSCLMAQTTAQNVFSGRKTLLILDDANLLLHVMIHRHGARQRTRHLEMDGNHVVV